MGFCGVFQVKELDDFRPRIRNWARVYKNRFRRMQSPLATVLHNLKLLYGTPTPDEDATERVDEVDAAFIDSCFLKLSESRRKVLYFAYIDARASETFDSASDMKRAEKVKARILGLRITRDYRELLQDAEMALMDRVHATEELLALTSEDEGDRITSSAQ